MAGSTLAQADSTETSCLRHDRPVFVIGCQRSGTTLLRAMLTAHPHIAIPYEAGRFKTLLAGTSPWKRTWDRETVSSAVGELLASRRIQFWGLRQEDVHRQLEQTDEFCYGDILAAMLRAYAAREGKPRWGEKTPRNTFDLRRIARAFPNAQFVHIVRDGRDVHLSWNEHVPYYDKQTHRRAKLWAHWIRAAMRGERLGSNRFLTIRYEDLVSDPEHELHTVLGFLGEPYDASCLQYFRQDGLVPASSKHMHRHLARPVDSSRAYRWRSEMPLRDQLVFELVAAPYLRRYGYHVRWPIRFLRSFPTR